MQILLDQQAIATSLEQLAEAICAELSAGSRLALIGIRTRGETLAQRLEALIGGKECCEVVRGTLDITLYRDDLSRKGLDQPKVQATEIDFEINDEYIVLVDDVLWTGRTIRAALDALTDLGRPQVIRLAVLVDRGQRELPIQADFVGRAIEPPSEGKVSVLLQEIDGVDAVKLI